MADYPREPKKSTERIMDRKEKAIRAIPNIMQITRKILCLTRTSGIFMTMELRTKNTIPAIKQRPSMPKYVNSVATARIPIEVISATTKHPI